jgi:hypothetical protein
MLFWPWRKPVQRLCYYMHHLSVLKLAAKASSKFPLKHCAENQDIEEALEFSFAAVLLRSSGVCVAASHSELVVIQSVSIPRTSATHPFY